MIIELQEPFKSLWSKGYLRVEATGRKYLSLYNAVGDQTSISYARYLMCVHLGYILAPDLEVDHRDDDCTNDDINNLQVLTAQENLLKQQWNYTQNVQECRGYACAWCNTYFILTMRQVNMRLAQNVEMAFCSQSCSSSYHHHHTPRPVNLIPGAGAFVKGNTPHGVSSEQILEMKELKNSGMTLNQIGEKMGLHPVTVSRNWKK